MTALPLSASAGAPCDCESCAATITAPATLPTEVRAYVTSQPDGLLVAWLQLSPQAVDVLTERERTHALGLLVADDGRLGIYAAEYRTGQCAAYVRERLVSGDNVQAAARLALEPGALLTLDRRLYTIVGRTTHGLRLRGPAGGRVDLHQPLSIGNVWTAWHGGIGQRNAKLVTYRRQTDGAFVRVRY